MGIRQWLSEKAGLVRAIGAVVVCTIGARIVAPGINTEVLGDFFRSGGASPLARLYDWLTAGAFGRGALLALGIMPYVSARIYLRLWRIVSPRVEEPARRQKLIRWLTLGFSGVQSYGFAKFLENLPGAVANPGPQFVATTVLTLTASAMTAMWLFERPVTSDEVEVADAGPVSISQPSSELRLLNEAEAATEPLRQQEREVVERP